MKYSVTRENRGGSNVRQSSRAFLATLWHSIPNTFSEIFLFSDFSPLLVNIENSLIVNNFLPPTFEINQVTIFIDFSKNIHNRNTSFPSFYTIQTTHLDAVRFLDSEHLAVLLRRCYSHHIRRAVLPDRKTLLAPKKKKEVGWFFFSELFHCRVWVEGISRWMDHQSRGNDDLFSLSLFSSTSHFDLSLSLSRSSRVRLTLALALPSRPRWRLDDDGNDNNDGVDTTIRRKNDGFLSVSPLWMKRTSECAYGADCRRI